MEKQNLSYTVNNPEFHDLQVETTEIPDYHLINPNLVIAPNNAATSNLACLPDPQSMVMPAGPDPTIVPVFIRMPNRGKRELWPGSPLNYDKLRYLIAPCLQNHNHPPVRAHKLCKLGKKRGVVLIDYLSLLQWIYRECLGSIPCSPPPPLPKPLLPPLLSVVKSGKQCPHTGLRHTMLYELSRPDSPYGRTGIRSDFMRIPGHKTGPIVIEPNSLIHFIRTLPPPQYTIQHFKAPLKIRIKAASITRKRVRKSSQSDASLEPTKTEYSAKQKNEENT